MEIFPDEINVSRNILLTALPAEGPSLLTPPREPFYGKQECQKNTTAIRHALLICSLRQQILKICYELATILSPSSSFFLNLWVLTLHITNFHAYQIFTLIS